MTITVKDNAALSAVHRLSHIAPWSEEEVLCKIQVAYDRFFHKSNHFSVSLTISIVHKLMLTRYYAMQSSAVFLNYKHNFLSSYVNYSSCI